VATGVPFQSGKEWKKDLLAKGINLFSIDWPERSKNWFFAHGGSLDPETGELVVGGTIREAA
jgi:hypothetical protein